MKYIFETTEKIEKCADCPCYQEIDDYGECFCGIKGMFNNGETSDEKNKLPDCPLKEFPDIPTENLASVIQSIGEALIATANNLRGVSEKYDAH